CLGNGAVGFIEWLGPRLLEPNFALVLGANVKRLMNDTINHDDVGLSLAVRIFGEQLKGVSVAEYPSTFVNLVCSVPRVSAVRAKVEGAALLRSPLAGEQLRRHDWRRR